MLKKEGILLSAAVDNCIVMFMENEERNRREKMHDISSGERQRRADKGLTVSPSKKKKRYKDPNLYMR
jgi:hypothetical protein